MANKILLTEMDDTPPQIAFANFAGDFAPGANNDLRKGIDIQGELVLLNLLNATAVQSAKVDLGVNFANEYLVVALIEMQVAAATAGSVVEFYWNSSSSATPAVGNMGAATGVSGAYSGYSSDLADAVKQLIDAGIMTMTDDAVDSAQIGVGGVFRPLNRYGSLVVKNETGQTICDTDDIEAHVVLIPIIPEVQ